MTEPKEPLIRLTIRELSPVEEERFQLELEDPQESLKRSRASIFAAALGYARAVEAGDHVAEDLHLEKIRLTLPHYEHALSAINRSWARRIMGPFFGVWAGPSKP